MNARSLRKIAVALPLASAFVLLITLGGCTHQLPAVPTTADVPEGKAPALRGQQSISLKNAYSVETKVIALRKNNNTFEVDLKQYTDSAIGMLERQMKKDGISIDSAAAKTITLRVRDMSATMRLIPFSALFKGSLTLEAELGDGTKTAFRDDKDTTPYSGGMPGAWDGAIQSAVTSLLNDKQFVSYVNRQ